MSIDLAPTFLKIAGKDIPEQFDGVDLGPLLHTKKHGQQKSKMGSRFSSLSKLWGTLGQTVFGFSQENSADYLSKGGKSFRTSVIYEYFGEQEKECPECPKLDDQTVFVSSRDTGNIMHSPAHVCLPFHFLFLELHRYTVSFPFCNQFCLEL